MTAVPAGGEPTAAAPVRLRVLSYNVHGLSGDLDALTGTVRALAPDVVCVQEAPRRLRWRSRCAELARRCELYVGAGGAPAIGNLLLVSGRVRVYEQWALRFPLTPGRHLRAAVFARCVIGRTPFVAVGAHLGTDPVERPEHARRLAAAVAGLRSPVVLGADLNEPPGGPAWAALNGPAGLVDPVGVIGAGATGEATGNSATPTFSVDRPRHRIDVVLAAAGCRPVAYRVVDDAAVRRASDHFPVLAEFELPTGLDLPTG